MTNHEKVRSGLLGRRHQFDIRHTCFVIFYSYRSATIGSTFMARRAGT
jgi:hypothetical protein